MQARKIKLKKDLQFITKENAGLELLDYLYKLQEVQYHALMQAINPVEERGALKMLENIITYLEYEEKDYE